MGKKGGARKQRKLKGYSIEWRDARREGQRRRETGGCVMAVKEKKKKLEVEWERERTDKVIKNKNGRKGVWDCIIIHETQKKK